MMTLLYVISILKDNAALKLIKVICVINYWSTILSEAIQTII